MKSSERFKKFATAKRNSIVSWLMVASLLVIGVSAQSSESALKSVAGITANVTAERWITPSIEAFPIDYQSGTVNWQKAGAYTSYDLQWGLTSNFSGASTARVTALSYTISGLTALTTYYFRVRAVGAPTATWSSVASMKTPEQAPTTQSVLFSTPDPHGADLDSAGNLWVAEWVEGSIKKVTPAGVVTQIGAPIADSHPRGLSLVNNTTAVLIRSYSDAVRDDPLTGLYTINSAGVSTMRAQFYRPYGTVYSAANNKVYVSHERYLSECDYVTWVCTQVMEQAANNIGHLNITPDGTKVTMAGGNNNVLSVYDIATKTRTVLFSTPAMDVRGAVAIGNNDFLACSWKTGDVWRIKLDPTTGDVAVETLVTGTTQPRTMLYNASQNITYLGMTNGAESGVYKYMNLIR